MTPPATAAAERDPLAPMPLIAGQPTDAQLNTELLNPILGPMDRWKILVGLAAAGTSLLLVGLAMLVLPGPALLVIPAALAILAIEFVWARRWLAWLHERLKALATNKSPSESAGNLKTQIISQAQHR